MSPLERAVEVDTDAVARDTRVLVSEREDKGGVVAKADAPLADAQAALGLAEEHHVGWQREVGLVLQRVAAQQLWGLRHAVTAGLPEGGERDRQTGRGLNPPSHHISGAYSLNKQNKHNTYNNKQACLYA